MQAFKYSKHCLCKCFMRNKSTFNTDLKNTYNEFWQKKKTKKQNTQNKHKLVYFD